MSQQKQTRLDLAVIDVEGSFDINRLNEQMRTLASLYNNPAIEFAFHYTNQNEQTMSFVMSYDSQNQHVTVMPVGEQARRLSGGISSQLAELNYSVNNLAAVKNNPRDLSGHAVAAPQVPETIGAALQAVRTATQQQHKQQVPAYSQASLVGRFGFSQERHAAQQHNAPAQADGNDSSYSRKEVELQNPDVWRKQAAAEEKQAANNTPRPK